MGERARTGTAGCLSDFSSPSSQSELRGQTERISAVLDSGKKPRIRFFFSLAELFPFAWFSPALLWDSTNGTFRPSGVSNSLLFIFEKDSRRPAAGSDVH